uniref:Exonuclease domain-containing protein n=1 Tax=Odontella aurita TaxID=265563 RepID=A0A7S4MVH6_9STRA|mmetsp:Transcript_35131/g.104878  ORF Transcript_35131/g.104878 Transcript_35131/m.104878 type:complete len:527 (+) Transcript_35131:230-1810(+)
MGHTQSTENSECSGDICGCISFPLFLKNRRHSVFEETSHNDDKDREAELVALAAEAGAGLTDDIDLVLTDVEDGIDLEKEEEEVTPGNGIETEENRIANSAPPPADLISQLAAVDCGMALVKRSQPRKRKNRNRSVDACLALRRVCVVDGNGRPLLNETVCVPPSNRSHGSREYYSTFASYLSRFLPRVNKCGDDLDIGVTPEEARERASKLLRNKIVIGHSVSVDLMALGLDDHPPDLVRDTASYAPFMRKNGKSNKLRNLTKLRLGRSIQPNGKFHCCVEDAVAALDLYKLVWEDWEESIIDVNKTAYRESELTGISDKQNGQSSAPNLIQKGKRRKKRKGNRKRGRVVKQKGIVCKYLLHVFFFPILTPVKALHDLILLTMNAVKSLNRKICGQVTMAPSFSRRKRRRSPRRRMQFDSLVLLLHGLSEVFSGLSALGLNEHETVRQSASRAVSVGLIGFSLLFVTQRQKTFFGVLAQYHAIALWIKLTAAQSPIMSSDLLASLVLAYHVLCCMWFTLRTLNKV